MPADQRRRGIRLYRFTNPRNGRPGLFYTIYLFVLIIDRNNNNNNNSPVILRKSDTTSRRQSAERVHPLKVYNVVICYCYLTHSDRQRGRVETTESSVRLLEVFKCGQRLFQQRLHVPVAVVVFHALKRQYSHAQRICGTKRARV